MKAFEVRSGSEVAVVEGKMAQNLIFVVAKGGEPKFFTEMSTFKDLAPAEQLEYLIKQDEHGNTPLHYASARSGIFGPMTADISIEDLKRAIAIKNNHGQSSIQYGNEQRMRRELQERSMEGAAHIPTSVSPGRDSSKGRE